ncbi:hypothetical protein [Saccharothrix sp.]|uniref:hypothetical protein n=1 Tax=Saccharothrix sp. TaxID=1873460 RepID=UPI002811B171|nr:hypothetical protein [Saccharothrix sp.]
MQGRGEALRVNYRNRERVLDFARGFDADNAVDDLDGAAGVTLRDAEVAAPGGEARRWHGTWPELGKRSRRRCANCPCRSARPP